MITFRLFLMIKNGTSHTTSSMDDVSFMAMAESNPTKNYADEREGCGRILKK